MDAGAGFTIPDEPREPILSVTLVFTGLWFWMNQQFFWLVITDKRIIVFNTREILAASGKDPADFSLQDRVRRLVIPEETSIATREKIQAMHPSAIAAAYPDAVIIPVSTVARFAIDQGYDDLFLSSFSPRWRLEITRQDKTGRDTQFRFISIEFPTELVSAARALFGKRFVAPEVLYHGPNFWHYYKV